MMTQVNFDSIGGGGIEIPDLADMQTATDRFTAEVGKTYLLMSHRYNTDGSISSGATEVSRCNAFTISNQHVFVMVVTATATTVVLTGSSNTVRYMPLD